MCRCGWVGGWVGERRWVGVGMIILLLNHIVSLMDDDPVAQSDLIFHNL